MSNRPKIARRGTLVAICAAAVLVPLARPARAEAWVVWKSGQMELGLYVPAGWTIEEQESVIELKRYLTGEQALVIVSAVDPGTTARGFGDGIVDGIRQQYADLKAAKWQGGAEESAIVSRGLTYTEEGTPFRGACCSGVARKTGVWICYSAPAGSYSTERAEALLTTLLEAVVPQALTRTGMPDAETLTAQALPESRLEAAGRAFVFVLEFALSAPFTAEQETLILAELLDGWAKLPEGEFAKVEVYGQLPQSILHADADSAESLRADRATTTEEWLDETDQSDPAVRAVRQQLERKGKVVVRGKPALTEVAAAAYAEMYAFSEQLAADPTAALSDVDPRSTDSLRQRLEAAWPGFSEAEREAVVSSPSLWLTLRAVERFGTPEDRQAARDRVALIAARATQPAGNGGDGGGGGGAGGAADPIDRLIQSNTMLAIQQQTFNTWMWSQGFHQTMLGW
jgi:hypothetical protein